MQRSQKPQNKKVLISKPFLKGKPFDSLSGRAAVKFAGSLVLVMVIFLIMGMMLMIDQVVIRLIMNALILILCYGIFFSIGGGSGSSAVNQGEILQTRLDRGGEVRPNEQACCYHPLKGFVIGLIGSLPIFLAALVFSLMTERQMTSMGALPSWISELSGHEEVSSAVGIYQTTAGMTLQEILRIIVRMSVMPFVNIFDSSNMDNMLLLERISPALVLLPAFSFGLGYMQGPNLRARVHGDIAQGKRRHAKKERRDHKRRAAARQPQQLN